MKATTFSVIKKSAGYNVKNLPTEAKAREFAAICCRNNHNDDYIVCVYSEGMFHEI